MLNAIVGVLESNNVPGLHSSGSGGILVGNGLGSWMPGFTSWLPPLLGVNKTDIFDIHFYPANPPNSPNLITMLTQAAASGKLIGMSEHWLNKNSNAEYGSISSNTVFARNIYDWWAPFD